MTRQEHEIRRRILTKLQPKLQFIELWDGKCCPVCDHSMEGRARCWFCGWENNSDPEGDDLPPESEALLFCALALILLGCCLCCASSWVVDSLRRLFSLKIRVP